MSIDDFNISGVGQKNGNFGGLPFTSENANIVLLPVPWDVTVSSGAGTSNGPSAILDASTQLDFYDERIPNAWKFGIYMDKISDEMLAKNKYLREKSTRYIQWLENGEEPSQADEMMAILEEINLECQKIVDQVEEDSTQWLEKDKIVGIIGGDHSTPLGLIKALSKKYSSFGILHLDAHCDLRDSYEGFEYSHASIMHNALKIPEVSRIVQVGVRDFCEEEVDFVTHSSGGRVRMYTGRKIHRSMLMGNSWSNISERITSQLPGDIYVSFDIDALNTWLCPNTGTPVPGGLDFEQTFFLLEGLVEAGIRIIGFDVTEVAPRKDGLSIDANIGARVAYRLSCLAAISHGYGRMCEI